jgi:hypothetical protein
VHDQALEDVCGLVDDHVVHDPNPLSGLIINRGAVLEGDVGDRPAKLSGVRIHVFPVRSSPILDVMEIGGGSRITHVTVLRPG